MEKEGGDIVFEPVPIRDFNESCFWPVKKVSREEMQKLYPEQYADHLKSRETSRPCFEEEK